MAYKRRYKKRTYKKRSYKRKPKGPQKLLPKMSRTVEKKISDSYITGQTVGNVSGYVSALNLIAGGSSQYQRVGNQVKVVGVEIQLEILSTVNNNLRFMLVYDKQTNGALPSISDFIVSVSGAYQPWAAKNYETRNRFVTLKKWNQVISLGYSGQTKRTIINHYCKIPKGVVTIYNGTGSSISNVITGGIYLVATSDDSSNGVTVYGYCRVRYTDD